jgi:acetyltransferase-like isoleucine patch superfamily enzyme
MIVNERELSTPALSLGRQTYYSPDLVLKTWLPGERIVIGRYCSIGERVIICTGGLRWTDRAALYPFDVTRWYQTTRTTTIGNDVWIGYGAMILNGATIGDGAIVAAGSVVFTDAPPFAVVAGNPARIVRYRFSKGVAERLKRIAWWNWTEREVSANAAWFERPIAEFLDRFDPLESTSDGRDLQNPAR